MLLDPPAAQPYAPQINTPPATFDPARDLPEGFMQFYRPLHAEFAARQAQAVARRATVLQLAHAGQLPSYLPAPTEAGEAWRIELPPWARDQRNQMTGPADDAELVVKMLNSGAPGVMLDLEDSIVNTWEALRAGVSNIVAALHGILTYEDRKRGGTVAIAPSRTVIFSRVRGLHLHQNGIVPGETTPASLFDLALIAYSVEPEKLKHPLCIYIPKSESAGEAFWWRDALRAVATALGWPSDSIKCMALVESHPAAFELEAFIFNLRDHLLGLNLGRWDYMASLIHYNLRDPQWVLPDRNTIPHDIAFFQNLRKLIPQITHRHGMLAIGGMTALFPSREDAALNERALSALATDKKNEAGAGMDGAWTGHPDQNAVAVAQFPHPNQLESWDAGADLHPDLRPKPTGVGTHSEAGTRAAIRTVIRYRQGVLDGLGASVLDGYMEDLATDRIYRLMIAQRILHGMHSAAQISQWFDEELKILGPHYARARTLSEAMIASGRFDPV
ncbi:MAG: malate synthase A [Vulcanimicrobiaceae bacterium]